MTTVDEAREARCRFGGQSAGDVRAFLAANPIGAELAASGDVEAARAALLHLLGDATSSTAVEDLEAAVRAESAQELAALREAVAAHHPSGQQCLFLAATPEAER